MQNVYLFIHVSSLCSFGAGLSNSSCIHQFDCLSFDEPFTLTIFKMLMCIIHKENQLVM